MADLGLLNSKKKKILCFIVLIFCFLIDIPVLEYFSQEHLEWLRLHARNITDIALAENWFAICFLTVAISQGVIKFSRIEAKRNKAKKSLNWALHFLSGLIFSGVLVHLFKFIAGRYRPVTIIKEEIDFAHHFHWFSLHHDYQSFPSGHTQVIFCAFIYLSFLIPNHTKKILFVAIVLALTRIITLYHFPSDVWFGCILAFVGSSVSIKVWEKKLGKL
jgi:membrane-associated phospholipid phosphatase